MVQTLKKDGVLTTELEQNLRNCRSADELDHVVRIKFVFQSVIHQLTVIRLVHS